MKVTLITATFNDLVHGTFNDKKTGCGINLLKPENVSRYRRSGEMQNMGEITCEKCKYKIAKEMIKADAKENKALLKEERMRAKRGDDDGLVQLSEYETKPTSLPTEPEPEPETPVVDTSTVQVNTSNPAFTDDLAQFAIKKPVEESAPAPAPAPVEEESVDDFLAQFAVQKPQETPAPAPVEEESVDDFLAQFAVQKPQEAPASAPVEEESTDDFLAQFAVQKPQEASAPAPVEEESTDDFLAQFAVQKPQEAPASAPVEEESTDDFLAQFAVQKPQETPAPTSVEEESTDDFLAQFSVDKSQEVPAPAPVEEESTDDFLAQFAVQKPQEAPAPAPVEEESTDDFLAQFAVDKSQETPAPAPVEEESTDDFLAQFAVQKPQESPAPAPVEEESTDDFLAQFAVDKSQENSSSAEEETVDDFLSQFSVSAPAQEYEEETPAKPPVLDDISSVLEAMNSTSSASVHTNPEPEEDDGNILSMFAKSADDYEEESIFDSMDSAEEPKPEIEDIKVPEIETPVQPQSVAPQPVQPQPVAPQPVQSQPVAPQPFQPQPMPQMTAMPSMPAGVGQIVTVPQITGYSENGQPIYAYAQMLMQGYDPNGQPILMPLPTPPNMMGMGMPMPAMPVQPVQQPIQPMAMQPEFPSYNQNSRLQEALAALDAPVSEKEMTIGQKIAAANAAQGSPVSANVSKIATNPHARSTSRAFTSAISESKSATQSLTETQGLQSKTPVLDSIEDVLAQLGDSSLKEKREAEAAAAAKRNTPVYEEFRTPARTSSSSFSRPVPSSSSSSSGMDDLPLTKAQQKELRRQQKIDEKFRKEMAKRKK